MRENYDGGRTDKEAPGKWNDIWEDPDTESDLCKMIGSSINRKHKRAIHTWPDHEELLETINISGEEISNFV